MKIKERSEMRKLLLLFVLFVGMTQLRAQAPAGRGQATDGRRTGQAGAQPAAAPMTEVGPPAPLGIQPGQAVVILDPAANELIDKDAKLELVRDDFGNLEGSNWIQDGKEGYLESIDMIGNDVIKMTPDGKVSVLVDKAGYTGMDPWNVGLDRSNRRDPKDPLYMYYFQFGPDGSTIDKDRHIIVAGMFSRNVYRVEKLDEIDGFAGPGKRTILADKYQGKQFCGPNDVIVKRDGSIYFSDTQMGVTGKGFRAKPADCPPHGFYRIKDGQVTLEIEGPANGLAFSPDEKVLYTVCGGNKLCATDVRPDGSIVKDSGRVLIDESLNNVKQEPQSLDGIRVDSKGNIYGAGPGGLWITSPEGKHIATVRVPAETAWFNVVNLTFGGMDYKTLYMVGRSRVYRIQLKVAGNRVFPPGK